MKKYFIRSTSKVNTKTLVTFIPGTTINCNPPYIKGVKDSCWANVTGINPTDKEQSENAIGMTLLPITN